jgi:membrane-associated phospholipid phosphatase
VFAAYVGASRIASDKHHLSDVLMGATLGLAAGRTVTVSLAGQTFDVGIAPTDGGAAVMCTKRVKWCRVLSACLVLERTH